MNIEHTIDNAVAWSTQVLLDKLKKDKGDYIVIDADIARTLEDPQTTYYEDAIKLAITEYLHKKRWKLVDDTFKVTLIVTGKKADGVFPMTVGPSFTYDSTIDELQEQIVKPATRKLVEEASKNFPFSEVESVTCCVEDNDFEE